MIVKSRIFFKNKAHNYIRGIEISFNIIFFFFFNILYENIHYAFVKKYDNCYRKKITMEETACLFQTLFYLIVPYMFAIDVCMLCLICQLNVFILFKEYH